MGGVLSPSRNPLLTEEEENNKEKTKESKTKVEIESKSPSNPKRRATVIPGTNKRKIDVAVERKTASKQKATAKPEVVKKKKSVSKLCKDSADVSVLCGCKEFRVSKKHLSEASLYFNVMLNNEHRKKNSDRIALCEVKPWEFEIVLEMIQTQETTMTTSPIDKLSFKRKLHFLDTCHVLLLTYIYKICVNSIVKDSKNLDCKEIKAMWDLADRLRDSTLWDAVIEYGVDYEKKQNAFPMMFRTLSWDSYLMNHVRNRINGVRHCVLFKTYQELVTPVNFLILWIKLDIKTHMAYFSNAEERIQLGKVPTVYVLYISRRQPADIVQKLFDTRFFQPEFCFPVCRTPQLLLSNDKLDNEIREWEEQASLSSFEAKMESNNCTDFQLEEHKILAAVCVDRSTFGYPVPAFLEFGQCPQLCFLGCDEFANEKDIWDKCVFTSCNDRLVVVYRCSEGIGAAEMDFVDGRWKRLSCHWEEDDMQPECCATSKGKIYLLIQGTRNKESMWHRKLLAFSMNESAWNEIDSIPEETFFLGEFHLLSVNNDIYGVVVQRSDEQCLAPTAEEGLDETQGKQRNKGHHMFTFFRVDDVQNKLTALFDMEVELEQQGCFPYHSPRVTSFASGILVFASDGFGILLDLTTLTPRFHEHPPASSWYQDVIAHFSCGDIVWFILEKRVLGLSVSVHPQQLFSWSYVSSLKFSDSLIDFISRNKDSLTLFRMENFVKRECRPNPLFHF